MRFRRLELVRYGGFADRVLDFGDGSPDLHLVIGPNEAGKSTMLAAIGDLLFGIPSQSAQNWRYDYADLRIRALIASSTGQFDVTRRKGKKNTLLAGDGSALPDDVLAPMLNGMDRRSFERMFGLDHAKLREGGEAILDGRDDAARIVLEAGTGFAGIGAELKKLDEQAGTLFKPSAQNPTVNRLMRERTDALAVVRSATLADTDWTAIQARRETAEARRMVLVEEGRRLAQRAHAIERINRTRPLLVRRASEQEALDRLGPVPRVPADAKSQLDAALAERRTVEELLDRETAKRNRAGGAAAAIIVPVRLLAAKPEIETLFARLAVAEKASADLVERRAERAAMVDRAARVRADAGLAIDHPVPSAGVRKRLRDLLEAGRRLESDLGGHHRNGQAIDEDLAKLPPEDEDGLVATWLDALRGAVDGIASDAGARAIGLATTRDRLRVKLENSLAGLAPWSGTIEALRATVPPGVGETSSAAADIDAAQARVRSAAAEIEDHRKQRIGLQSELASLVAGGTLPTPEVVAAARAARDSVVETVRTRLGFARSGDDAQIGAALEEAIGHADALADRRDADAERIAQHAVLTRRLAELDARIAAAGAVLTPATKRCALLTAGWADLLGTLGFTRPLPPADLDRWRIDRSQTLSIADDCAAAEEACRDFDAELEARRAVLDRVLGDTGVGPSVTDPLEDRLAVARHHIGRLDAMVRTRDLAAVQRRRISDAREKHALEDRHLTARQVAFDADRAHLLHESGLSEHLSADAIADALQGFEELAADAAALATIERQVALDEQLLRAFEDEVDTLLRSLDQDLTDKRFERMRGLNDALLEAASAQATLRRLQTDEQEAIQALVGMGRRLAAVQATLDGLKTVTGTTSDTALAACIEAGRQAQAHAAELQRLADELESLCEGLDLADVVADAEALSADDAVAELETIRIRRQEIEEARETVGRDLAGAEADIAAVATKAAAADAQQDSVAIATAMADAAERHVEAAAAAALLRWVIDRHRATAQAPLIERAGVLFAQVTAGAFAGLVLDYNDDDRPIIKGVRADGSRVGVEGMSEGTRDQLYLALRLGAIGGQGGSHALPVVCDDLLITADDGRAAEMLRALATASRGHQIILFSHHDHIVDVADSAVGRERFRLHRIDRTRG